MLSFVTGIFMTLYSEPGIIQNKRPAQNYHHVAMASMPLFPVIFLDFVSEKDCFWALFFLNCLSPQEHSIAQTRFVYMEERTKEGWVFFFPSSLKIRKLIKSMRACYNEAILLSVLNKTGQLQEGENTGGQIYWQPKDGWAGFLFIPL